LPAWSPVACSNSPNFSNSNFAPVFVVAVERRAAFVLQSGVVEKIAAEFGEITSSGGKILQGSNAAEVADSGAGFVIDEFGVRLGGRVKRQACP